MEASEKRSKGAQEGQSKKARKTGHKPEECPVCMKVFNGTVQLPRTLPCGHTVCTLCVNKLKQQGHVTCPECRANHTMPEGGQFPINYTVEALLREKEGAEAAAAGQKEAGGLARIMLPVLQKVEASILTPCQEVQVQLDQYQTTLKGWGEQQQQLEDRLQGLLDQSRSARELVRQEESRAEAKKEEVRKKKQQLHAALEAPRTPAAEQEAGVAVVKVFRCIGEVKQVLKECRESFPDANTITTVMKVGAASYAAPEAFQAELEAYASVPEKKTLHQLEADSTIEDRLQAILTPGLKSGSTSLKNWPDISMFAGQLEADSTIEDRVQAILTPGLKSGSTSLKAEDLRSPTQPVRRLLEAGRVFGVHQVEGQRRHARISLEGNQVYLHTLKEGPLPPGALTLEVSQLVPPSPPCVVFLDLSWPGSAPRRVHIQLSPDTPQGRQMVLLCTGQRGPSYAGTCLFEVFLKGEPGEHVAGGDYESNDGRGGAALLPGLGEDEYKKSGKAGAVCGILDNPALGAVFYIITRDRGDNKSFICVFGEVVQGLDAVVAAAQHTPITQVTVKNCGVVL